MTIKKSYHAETCFNNKFRIYLNEKLTLSYFSEKCSDQCKVQKAVFAYQKIFENCILYQKYYIVYQNIWFNNLFINFKIIAIINPTLSKLRILQYFVAEMFSYFLSTITDTSHIPSTIIQTKLYLSTQCAEDLKPCYIGNYIFFLTPSFPTICQDQLNIGLDRLIFVWIG